MVTLYRRPDDTQADEIEEALNDMAIAHEVERVGEEAPLPEDLSPLPALREDSEVVTGASALRTRLQALRDLMADWHRFQSDACYVEEDGSIC